jgi:PAS domain S-box-containing protein
MSYVAAIERLAAVVATLSNATTIDELADGLVDGITGTIPATHTGFYFYELGTSRLRLVNARGYTEADRIALEQTAVTRHPMQVIRTGRMLHVPDTWNDPENRTTVGPTGVPIRSRLHFPVRCGEDVVGCLGLGNTAPNAFAPESISLIALAANLAGAIYGRLQALDESRRKEEQLRLALEGAQLGSWDWDVKTGSVIFNARWAEMLGYDLHELEGNVSTWERLLHPDDVAQVTGALQAHLSGTTDVYKTEHRLLTKSGAWKWVLDAGRILRRDEHGAPSRAAGIHQDIDDRKQVEQIHIDMQDTLTRLVAERTASLNQTVTALRQQVEERERAEQSLVEYQHRLARATESLVVAEEAERRRLAQALHDGIGQELTLLRLRLRAALLTLSPEHASTSKLSELDDTVKHIMRLTRGLTMDLSPVTLEQFGLQTAVQALLERTRDLHGLAVSMQWRASQQLSELHGTVVYGALREIIHNAIKHARATTLTVTCWRRGDAVWVRVQDDGVGFPRNFTFDGPSTSGSGFGLFAWRERLHGVGAKLHVGRPGRRGAEVAIELDVGHTAGSGHEEKR